MTDELRVVHWCDVFHLQICFVVHTHNVEGTSLGRRFGSIDLAVAIHREFFFSPDQVPVSSQLCDPPTPTLVKPCIVSCPQDCLVGEWGSWGTCLPHQCKLARGKMSLGTFHSFTTQSLFQLRKHTLTFSSSGSEQVWTFRSQDIARGIGR